METIEFLKEYKRMCLSKNYCVDCEFRKTCIYTHRPCDMADEMFEKVIAYVEQWSKEHPIITNARKFKEVFGFSLEDTFILPSEVCNWMRIKYEEP